jgi:predicted metal-binding membrane protein
VSGFRVALPESVERGGLVAAVGVITAAAWAVLAFADTNGHGILHSHGMPDLAASFRVSTLGVFLVAWTGMSVAMMLPTSLPVLMVLHTFARERDDRWLLLALAATGYLAAWVAVGVLAGPFSLAVHGVAMFPQSGYAANRLVLPALLLLAGLFQFSALKYRCLEKCRSPLNFVLSHWQGRRDRWNAFLLGWASGVFCVGCCWALMLLMLVSSVHHLALMLVLGLVMAVEKNVRWGRRLSAPLGIALIACAVTLFLVGGESRFLSQTLPELCGLK